MNSNYKFANFNMEIHSSNLKGYVLDKSNIKDLWLKIRQGWNEEFSRSKGHLGCKDEDLLVVEVENKEAAEEILRMSKPEDKAVAAYVSETDMWYIGGHCSKL